LLPEGTISFLHYSHKVAALLVALFSYALLTVLFPHMSKLVAANDFNRLKDTLAKGIVTMTAIMLPLSVGMFVLAQPGIRILFQRGSFTIEDTIRTASCLRMYAFFVFSSGLTAMLLRGFYAIQSTKTPGIILSISVFVGVGLNFLLINPLGAEGLALAVTLSNFLGMTLLFVFLRRKLGNMGLKRHLPDLIKITLISGLMGVALLRATILLPLMLLPVWQTIILCALLSAIAGLFYFTLLFLTKCKIIVDVVQKIINKR